MTSALQILSASRAAVGAGTWAAPGPSWRTFGLGSLADAGPSAGIISRLFGARELALALGLRHPDPAVRRVVLQAGLAIDSIDVAASLIGLRNGAPRATLLGVAAGAASFVALGAVALGQDRPGRVS
ncbi:hypothetical protein [Nocardioides rubriscoriae]|uniref:hypothetical protein n=1 Tax=Nocardioides rubriscoriae TaxID=642762 RepID=UPI0011DF6A06|nr:hypothetical protein [Nocardioides rubriscoriae]